MNRMNRLKNAFRNANDFNQLRVGFTIGVIILMVVALIKGETTRFWMFGAGVIIIAAEYWGTVVNQYILGGQIK